MTDLNKIQIPFCFVALICCSVIASGTVLLPPPNANNVRVDASTGMVLRNHRSDRVTADIDLMCGGTFRGRQTTIQSPLYPNNYPPNVRCEYLFMSPFVCKNEFHLQFLAFSLESSPNCVKDNLTIGAYESLCGSVIGIMKYEGDKGMLRIVFSSDASGESVGFRIIVTRLPCLNGNVPAGYDDELTIGLGNGTQLTSTNDAQFAQIPPNPNEYPFGPNNNNNDGFPFHGPNGPPYNPQPQPGQNPNGIYPNTIPFVPNVFYYPQYPTGYQPPVLPYVPPLNPANCPPFHNHPPQSPPNVPPNYPSNVPSNYPSNVPSNYPNNVPSNYPSNVPPPQYPPSNIPDTHWPPQQYPIRSGISPNAGQLSPSNCCLNSFNARRFFLASPGFPNAEPPINTDCLYRIERNSPDICRLRIEFKYYFVGAQDSRFGCPDSFIELDGRRICGCNTGLVYTSQWGIGPKVIRYVHNHNVPPSFGVKGFILDIIQEPCPFRQTANNIRNNQHPNGIQSSSAEVSYARVPNIEFGTNGDRKHNIEKANARFYYPNTNGMLGGQCIFNYGQWLNLAANQFWLSKPVCLRP